MKSNLKRSLVISALTICLLLLLLTGTTYALFTDSASANIVVGSAKVDVEVKIKDVKRFSLDKFQEDGRFELGGTAEVDETTGELTLANIAPGDKVVFTLDITNNSNIIILERLRFVDYSAEVSPLLTILKVTIDKTEYKFDENGKFVRVDGKDLEWEKVEIGEEDDVVITIEFPKTAGNNCQDKTVNLQIILEAYQGNATAEDLKNPALPRE